MLAPLALVSQPIDPLRQIESTYNLRIERTQEPFTWEGAGYRVTGDAVSLEAVSKFTPLFVREWSFYPPSYIQKAIVHRIVFCTQIKVDGQDRVAVPAYDGNTIYLDPTQGSHNPQYQRATIHHELFHMADRRMGLRYSDPEWLKLNRADFTYGSGGKNMLQTGAVDLTDKLPGFLSLYGTSACEEDKADLFGHLVVNAPYVRLRATRDPILAAKVAFLKRRVAQFDPAMDEAFWKKVYRSW